MYGAAWLQMDRSAVLYLVQLTLIRGARQIARVTIRRRVLHVFIMWLRIVLICGRLVLHVSVMKLKIVLI